MGDGADYALDIAAMDYEHFDKYKYAPPHIQYEEGLVDELGYEINRPTRLRFIVDYMPKESGPGKCLKCEAQTIEKTGAHGKFYGCSKWPWCKGNRNY